MSLFEQKLDRKIILVATVTLILMSALLYQDYFSFSEKNIKLTAVVGTIQSIHQDTRRKKNDQAYWKPLYLNESIDHEDTLATGADSFAQLALVDGNTLELQENSTVQLIKTERKVIVHLQEGWFKTTFKRGQTFTLDHGKSPILVTSSTGGSMKLKRAMTGELELVLEKGSARINGIVAEINKPLTIFDGKVSAQNKVQLYLEQPSNEPIELIDGEAPDISYNVYGPSQDLRMVFIPRGKQTSPFEVKFDKNQIPQWPSKIPEGKYKVHLSASTATGEAIISNARELEVIYLHTPEIAAHFPSLHHAIVQPDNKGQLRKDIDLQWTGTRAKSYLVQMTQDQDFKSPLIYLTESPSIKIPRLAAGHYRIRIQAQGNSKQSAWSKVYEFQLQLEPEEIFHPQAPLLVTTDVKYSPETKTTDHLIEAGPRLVWTSGNSENLRAEQNLKFKVQLSNFEDFRTFQETIVQDHSFHWANYQRGHFFFRILAQNGIGLTSAPSATGRLQVDLKEIELKPLVQTEMQTSDITALGKTPVQLQWSDSRVASTYEIEVATTSDFQKSTIIKTSQTSATVQLKPGQYFIRIAGYDSAGNNLNITSNTQMLEFDFTLPLDRPALLEPKSDETILVEKKSPAGLSATAPLRWEPVLGAHSYIVEFAHDPDFLQIVHAIESRQNSAIIPDQVPAGSIYWRVKALSKMRKQIASINNVGEFSNWSEKRSLQLIRKDAPEGNSPARKDLNEF